MTAQPAGRPGRRSREGFAAGSRPLSRWLCLRGVLLPLLAEEPA